MEKTKKSQVRTADVSAVKHHILQQLPVFQYSAEGGAGAAEAGDAQLVNSVRSSFFHFFFGNCGGVFKQQKSTKLTFSFLTSKQNKHKK